MICPKCNTSNDEKYSFCLECGTRLHKNSDTSPELPETVLHTQEDLSQDETVVISTDNLDETVAISSDNFDKTVQLPPDKLPNTQQSSTPANTVENEASPTIQNAADDLQETQYYSPPNTSENEPEPTVQIPADKLPPQAQIPSQHTSTPIQPLNQQTSSGEKYSPPESVETEVVSKINAEDVLPDSTAVKKPKKSRKFLWAFSTFLLLLLLGGGAVSYYLTLSLQKNKSYLLSNKHKGEEDKVLEFDNQNSKFFMVASDKDASEKWQVTPDPNDKFYYRFVNRGVGEQESLEVVDNDWDSSISMAQSANDVGQSWTIDKVEGDYYRITNKWLGDSKALSHNKLYYYFLRLRDSGNKDGQLWKRTFAKNGGVYLTNKRYGDAISLKAIYDGEYKDKLIVKSGSSDDQKWIMDDVGNGYYNITTKQHKSTGVNKSLDVNSSKKDRVTMSASNGSGGQKWKMTPAGDGYFRLTNESLGEGKALEAVTFVKFNLEMVKSSDKDAGQLWKLKNLNK